MQGDPIALMALKMARVDGCKLPDDEKIEQYRVSAMLAVEAMKMMSPTERSAVCQPDA